jgi:ABC-2 type transport system permease protein
MLWYKAWLETRSRFLISLGGILGICSYRVYQLDSLGGFSGTSWYYFALQGAHERLCMLWVLAVMLLMMGGLVREKAVGASAFTLALPVSRTRLMGVRISMGLIEAMALAIVPWVVMFLIAITTGKASSVSWAVSHIVLLAGGGLIFFAFALLISSLMEGEYTAPAVSLGITLTVIFALGDRPLNAWSPLELVAGSGYIDRQNPIHFGPIPWLHLVVTILIAALFTAISIKAIQRREF